MGLDIDTPRGKMFAEYEQRSMHFVEKCWKDIKVNFTDKKKAVSFDGFIRKAGKQVAFFEHKSRNLNIVDVYQHGYYPISYSKIAKCRELSLLHLIPFYLFVYLIDDDITVFWQITDKMGQYCFKIGEPHVETTNNSCNGGEKVDELVDLSCDFMRECTLNMPDEF